MRRKDIDAMRGRVDNARKKANARLVEYKRMEENMIGSDLSSLGPAAAGLDLIDYRGSARIIYQTKGGGVLCRWWRRRRKGKLAQIVIK